MKPFTAILLLLALAVRASTFTLAWNPPDDTNGIDGYLIVNTNSGAMYGSTASAAITQTPVTAPFGAVLNIESTNAALGAVSQPSNSWTNNVLGVSMNNHGHR
jgi:hypothetical protein